MQKKNVYSLRLALDEMTAAIGTAMSVDGSLGIELLEALFISSDSTVSPNLFAL